MALLYLTVFVICCIEEEEEIDIDAVQREIDRRSDEGGAHAEGDCATKKVLNHFADASKMVNWENSR